MNTLNDALKPCALALYKPPFRFEHGYFYDADGNMVADKHEAEMMRVRGWGRISYKDNAEALQDAVGAMIAQAMTEYWNRANTPDSAAQGAMGDRERFEATLKKKRGFDEYHFERNDDGTYSRDHVEGYWHIWQLAQPSDATAQPIDPQVMGRVHNDEGQGLAFLNSIGRTLPDGTALYAAQPMDLTHERAAFEVWCEAKKLNTHRFTRTDDLDGEYYYQSVVDAWSAWQARALLANTAQGKTDHIVDANKMVSDSGPNAEWLTTAHIICTEQLIPCGHINNRLNALRDALAAKKG